MAEDSAPVLGALVLRGLVRVWRDSTRVMVIGTADLETELPPGDYSLALHLAAPLLGERVVLAESFEAVPSGMIRPGMRADQILTSGIDISPQGIERFKRGLPPVREDYDDD